MKIKDAMFILSAFMGGRVFHPDIGGFRDWSDKRFKFLEGYDHDFQTAEELAKFYKHFTPMEELQKMLTEIVTEEEVSHSIILLISILMKMETDGMVKKYEDMTTEELKKEYGELYGRGSK